MLPRATAPRLGVQHPEKRALRSPACSSREALLGHGLSCVGGQALCGRTRIGRHHHPGYRLCCSNHLFFKSALQVWVTFLSSFCLITLPLGYPCCVSLTEIRNSHGYTHILSPPPSLEYWNSYHISLAELVSVV